MQQHSYTLEKYGMSLLPLADSHLEQVLSWRNSDFVRNNMLNQEHICMAEHINWFERICKNDDEFHFVIEFNNKAIGAANIKRITSEIAESGLYIYDDAVRGSAYAFLPSLILLEFGFEQLALSGIRATVLAHNQAALRFNLKQGYEIVDQSTKLIQMHLTADNFNQRKQTFYRFFDR